jgi:murein DD-endopeptidase MepM/ murein hydrolase activator NlpD
LNPGPLQPHCSALAGLRHSPKANRIIARSEGSGKRFPLLGMSDARMAYNRFMCNRLFDEWIKGDMAVTADVMRRVINPGFVLAFLLMFSMVLLTGCEEPLSTQNATGKPEISIIPPSQTMPAETRFPKNAETRPKTAVPTATKPVEASTTPGTVKNRVCSPLEEHRIVDLPGIVSSPYDPPPMGKDDRHQGVDFAYYNQGTRSSIDGEGVTAILAGWVALVVKDRLPYGNMVILETPTTDLPEEILHNLDILSYESLYHLYAHLKEPPLVSNGDWVECGQLLGNVGKTGYNIPVPHLHLETRIGPSGTRFGGMVFYDTQGSESEMENYRTWRMGGTYRHFDPLRLFSYSEKEGD